MKNGRKNIALAGRTNDHSGKAGDHHSVDAQIPSSRGENSTRRAIQDGGTQQRLLRSQLLSSRRNACMQGCSHYLMVI